jgi:hypothetical protein
MCVFLKKFDFGRYLWLKKSNFNKNALSKIESQCNADSKHIFESKIAQVLLEKNIFKHDTAFAILKSAAHFSD